MELVRALVALATYPGLIALSIFGAHRALLGGASATLVVPIAFVGALGVISCLEHWVPFDARRPSRREFTGDGAYLLLAAVLSPLAKLFGTFLGASVSVLAAALTSPAESAAWARAIGALLVADLAKYMLHRLSHEHPGLWRFHAEHHAPTRVYALNGVRFHPVNLTWNLTLDAVPVVALGLDVHTATLLAVFRGAVAVLQHANLDLMLGPLRWVFSTPDLHRFHHSARITEANTNYGGTFILWDRLFGTFSRSTDRAPATYGLEPGTTHPEGLLHELAWPWCASCGCQPRASGSRSRRSPR